MELQIQLSQEKSTKDIIHLKNFIQQEFSEDLIDINIDRVVPQAGEMGEGAILNSIQTVIIAAQKPFVELIKCLQKYVDNYRTVITISTKQGDIKLTHGRSMKPEQLQEMVTKILEIKVD